LRQLSDILYKVRSTALQGTTDLAVNSVAIDSRKVEAGSLFVAVRGVAVDGHRFMEQAAAQGAVVLIIFMDSLPPN
jgi:UDP-N-acetylmuramoyl-L-alanyl-D-glutamate--2,6-diaminopimelate ligase